MATAHAAVAAPASAAGDWAGFGAKMTEFAERLDGEGLKLCYHHHMGTIVQSETDIDAFMANTKPPVHLLLDTGHATWGGADPAALARPIASGSATSIARTCAKRRCDQAHADDWSFLDSILGKGAELGVYTVPGRRHGRLCRACSGELKGYSGWVVLEAEQDPKKAPALPYAKKGVAHIRAALKEAGLG